MSKEAKVAAGLFLGVVLIGLVWVYATGETQPVITSGESLADAFAPPTTPDGAADTLHPSPQQTPPAVEPVAPAAPPPPSESTPDRLTRLDDPRPVQDLSTGAGDGQDFEQHIVRKGDSLASIANLYYQGARERPEVYLRLLQDANLTVVDPQALPANSVILIPPDPYEAAPPVSRPVTLPAATATPGERTVDAPRRTDASTSRPREYVVQSGDTFYGIAGKVLGTPSRWRELFELNRELVRDEPRNLRPGQRLRLPDA